MPRKTRVRDDLPALPRHASMRPRPDATENMIEDADGARTHPASMRPRPDATENFCAAVATARRTTCFNEAAARCHGKRTAPRMERQVGIVLQ